MPGMRDTNLFGYRLTQHARLRCAQRGYRMQDIELVLAYGTRTLEGVLLRYRDVHAPIEDIRRQIRTMQKKRKKAQPNLVGNEIR
jgi:hypothetical protein